MALLLALLAVLGIEQYVFVLGALAWVHWFRSRWHKPAHAAWIPVLAMLCLVLVFVASHYVFFSGTAERLARVTRAVQPAEGPGFTWKLAWMLSLLPGASRYGGLLEVGLGTLQGHRWLIALITVVALAAAWRTAAASSWRAEASHPVPDRRPWLTITGVAVFCAALLPFMFTGRYGFDTRNLYAALPGLVTVGAVVLDALRASNAWRRGLRSLLGLAVAAYVAISLTINIEMQSVLARGWQFHQDVMRMIEVDAEAICAAKALELTGIPMQPYRAISQMGNGWAFPCLVGWVTGDDEVQAWNNLMRPEDRPQGMRTTHRIQWRATDTP